MKRHDIVPDPAARTVAPFLVLAPAVIWEAVSADAVFAAVGAWALAVLASAAVRRIICWSLVAGLLFGRHDGGGPCSGPARGEATLTFLVAGLSLMSKAEVERIWLLVQHLLNTLWRCEHAVLATSSVQTPWAPVAWVPAAGC